MCLHLGILPALQAYPPAMPTCQALAWAVFSLLPPWHREGGDHETCHWTLTTVDLER